MFIVGFQSDLQETIGKIVQGDQGLSAVSIVAMGGSGKTTLAIKVYTRHL
jgi:hypothetical protein